MVHLQINAQKLVLISNRVARVYVSVSDRQVSYVLHDWFSSYVCVIVGHRHVESWQTALTAVKEQFKLESLFPEKENKEYSLKAKMCA